MSIKIARARAKSIIGKCYGTFSAMLAAVPSEVAAALTSTQLAALIDANYRLAQRSKSIAESEAIHNGCVWDAERQRHIGLERSQS